MIRICIIGEIGSSKIFFAKKFNYPVFNADYEVSKIYKKNKKCYKKIKKALPGYEISFPIKKKELLKAILNNSDNVKKISKVVHPEVRKKLKKFIKKYSKKKYVILDIPLLIENKLNTKRDILICIDGNKQKIKKILKKRNNLSFKILKKFQLPIETKKKKANFFIYNDFTTRSAKKNVKKIKKEILFNA